MKVSPEFLAAKKDKNLRYFVVSLFKGKMTVRLTVETKVKYSDEAVKTDIETETTIQIDNYSRCGGNVREPKEVKKIHFMHWLYQHESNCHIKTFLSHIKKDSDVSFKVIAYNSSQSMVDANMYNHQLFGIIDGKKYLLSSETCLYNTASPVHEKESIFE